MNALMVEPLSPNIPTEIERDGSSSEDNEKIFKNLKGSSSDEEN